MFKNVASQKIALFAYDSTTGAPKTGDGANLTPYVSKDYGTVTVLGTTTATEMDATNAKGWYSFVLTQAETNGDALLFTGKSSTANAFIVGQLIFTDPASFTSFVTPTNLTAAQIATGVWQDATGADFTAASSIGKSLYTTGNAPGAASGLALVGSNMGTITGALTGSQIATAVWTDTTAGDFTVALSVGKSIINGVTLGTGLTINSYTGNTPQTGDSFARIGALGAGLTGITGVTLAASQPGVTIPTVTTVTNQLTAAAVGAGVWRDAVAGDFAVAGSIGASLGGAFTSLGTAVYSIAALANGPSGSGSTPAAIATAVWQDTTAGDFTTAGSIGKSLFTSGNVPGAASGIALVGSNMGSVTSVTATVTANMTQIAGNSTAATALSNSAQSICYGTCSGGTLTTAVVSTLNNPSSITDAGQFIGRTIIFLGNTTTIDMQAQASNITATTTGSTPTITFTAMTHAPAAGDVFAIL